MDEKEPVLTIGTGRCKCSGCGRYFSGVTAFDRHHKVAKDGSAICLDPAERGMVLRNGWWGQPAPDKDAFSRIWDRSKRDEDPQPRIERPTLW